MTAPGYRVTASAAVNPRGRSYQFESTDSRSISVVKRAFGIAICYFLYKLLL